MAEVSPSGTGVSPTRRWASVGLASGLVVGFLLGLAGVTASVQWTGDTQHPAYRLRVVGVVVFRYPEDGELYPMRPGAQVFNARRAIPWYSAIACGVAGWTAGYGLGRRARLR
jgi:hypothetical protein